jgi:hypothetical protein
MRAPRKDLLRNRQRLVRSCTTSRSCADSEVLDRENPDNVNAGRLRPIRGACVVGSLSGDSTRPIGRNSRS